MTDISRRIKPGCALHKALKRYMKVTGSSCVGLSVPTTYPGTYVKGECATFWRRFPIEYVDELEALLAQGSLRCVLTINNKRETADVLQVATIDDFNRTLLSLFVQSVQQINPTSRVLYSMVNLKPIHGLGVFVSCETNQCCFKYLAAKIHATTDDSDGSHIRLYVRDHVHHNSLLDLSVVNKWMSCEYHALY